MSFKKHRKYTAGVSNKQCSKTAVVSSRTFFKNYESLKKKFYLLGFKKIFIQKLREFQIQDKKTAGVSSEKFEKPQESKTNTFKKLYTGVSEKIYIYKLRALQKI